MRWRQTDEQKMPEDAAKSLRLVYEVIEELLQSHPIDARRVYIVGRGMGGAGALEAAARRPEMFAAVVAGTPETYFDLPKRLSQIPVAVVLNSDSPRPSLDRQKEIMNELRDAGNRRVKDFEGDAFYAEQTYEWLFEQRR